MSHPQSLDEELELHLFLSQHKLSKVFMAERRIGMASTASLCPSPLQNPPRNASAKLLQTCGNSRFISRISTPSVGHPRSRLRVGCAVSESSRFASLSALSFSGFSHRAETSLSRSSAFGNSPLLLQSARQAASVDASKRCKGLDVSLQAGRGDTVNAAERIIAALGYLLPLFDGIQYGRYFFLQFPVAERLLTPLYPLLAAYKGFPYSNFIAFFALYLAVVRNPNFSRYVRFNTMQAVVLDVLLIFPTLVERTFTPRGGIGFELLVIFYNTVFLFLVACFVFGFISCLLGKTPRLPLVADAADQQV